MSVTDQLLTLAAVIVGAIMSFAATSLNERQRSRREEAARWAGEKLDAYLETWLACNRSLVDAKNRVHQQMRAELGIPGKFLPRDLEQPYDPKLPAPADAESTASR